MLWRKITVGALLSLCFTFVFSQTSWAIVDNTTCTVKSNTDSDGDFHSLRWKVYNGFNRPNLRACTELIKFEGADNEPMVIQLGSSLKFNGENDTDCSNESHQLCMDGISFTLDGTTHSAGVVIDTTQVNGGDDRCAIEVVGNNQVYKGLVIRTNQSQLLGEKSRDEDNNVTLPNAVICYVGNNNFDRVEIDPQGSGFCGDGIVQEGEECDDGDDNGSDKPCTDACTEGVGDEDGDGVPDDIDNCSPTNPEHDCGSECSNPVNEDGIQPDCDADGKGNACDNDWDNDGWADGIDNCAPDHDICEFAVLAESANPNQTNTDKELEDAEGVPNLGDLCDPDNDGDGILDDGDHSGDEGDAPCIGGAFLNCDDNCPILYNEDQEDKDSDGVGAACDPDDTGDDDTDGDTIPDGADNCPTVPNGPADASDQVDIDFDGFGDVCDDDMDGDGLTNIQEDAEACLDKRKADTDGDGFNDKNDPCPCDSENGCDISDPSDEDGDGILNASDNCPSHSNADQRDEDGDGVGDACDTDNPDVDTDGDGKINSEDNCPEVSNADQANQDGDSKGDACDDNPTEPDADISAEVESTGGGCSLSARSSGFDLGASLLVVLFLTLTGLGIRGWARGR